MPSLLNKSPPPPPPPHNPNKESAPKCESWNTSISRSVTSQETGCINLSKKDLLHPIYISILSETFSSRESFFLHGLLDFLRLDQKSGHIKTPTFMKKKVCVLYPLVAVRVPHIPGLQLLWTIQIVLSSLKSINILSLNDLGKIFCWNLKCSSLEIFRASFRKQTLSITQK